MVRIGPTTFPLPRECSTTELHRHFPFHGLVGDEGLAPPKAEAI